MLLFKKSAKVPIAVHGARCRRQLQ